MSSSPISAEQLTRSFSEFRQNMACVFDRIMSIQPRREFWIQQWTAVNILIGRQWVTGELPVSVLLLLAIGHVYKLTISARL